MNWLLMQSLLMLYGMIEFIRHVGNKISDKLDRIADDLGRLDK